MRRIGQKLAQPRREETGSLKRADAALRQQVTSDIHPPGEYRSDTVRNVDAWYKAFDIKPGDKLYLAPDKRVHIW
jgi:predicted metalloendopeptidase